VQNIKAKREGHTHPNTRFISEIKEHIFLSGHWVRIYNKDSHTILIVTHIYTTLGGRDSSISIKIRPTATNHGTGVSFLAGAENFSSPQHLECIYGPPSLLSNK